MIFFINSIFLGVTYLPQACMRVSMFLLTVWTNLVMREVLGDDFDLIDGIVSYTIYCIIVETSNYLNYRAKAELFIRLKISEQQ